MFRKTINEAIVGVHVVYNLIILTCENIDIEGLLIKEALHSLPIMKQWVEYTYI